MRHKDDSTPELQPSPWGRVMWDGHPGGGQAVVDVVTRDTLASYVHLAHTGADELLPTLRDAWLSGRREISESEERRRKR